MKMAHIFDQTIGGMALLAAILLAFVMLLVNAEVISRRFFNKPLVWELEITEYCLLFITFLGAAWLLKEEGHVRMDLLLNRLTPRSQNLLNVITSVIGIIVCFIFTWYGARLTLEYFQTNYYIGGSYLMPLKGPIMMVIPIGTFMLTIQFMRQTYKYLVIWRGLRHEA